MSVFQLKNTHGYIHGEYLHTPPSRGHTLCDDKKEVYDAYL